MDLDAEGEDAMLSFEDAESGDEHYHEATSAILSNVTNAFGHSSNQTTQPHTTVAREHNVGGDASQAHGVPSNRSVQLDIAGIRVMNMLVEIERMVESNLESQRMDGTANGAAGNEASNYFLEEDNENSNEASHMVSALAVNYEPIIIESEDSNSSTVPEVSTSRAMPRDENEPPTKCAKIERPPDDLEDDTDGQTCSICLDVWTVSGDHRLASLKCGHLFGHSCIQRWLKQMTKTNRCCPTCKTRATIRDVRFIYARKIAMVDNSEMEALKSELQDTKIEKRKLELDLENAILSQHLFFNKVTKLESEIIKLKQACIQPAEPPKFWRYALRANIEVAKDASCRVLAYNNRNKELYVSQMSTNSLFPGFAMRKVSCYDWKLGKLIHLHPKLIRDAAYSEENDLLMTVALDKTIKLVQGTNETIMSTVMSEMPLWSCCWDERNSNRFFVGGVGGVVLEYDIRQPKACIERIKSINDLSPVASLAAAPNGVLACHLNSFRAHCRKGATYESKQLSVDGSLLCVRRNPVTEDLLVSCRPSGNYQRSRHMICKVDLENDFDFVIKRTFEASNVQSVMARSAIYSIGDEVFVAAHSEADKSVFVWSATTGKRVQSLGASENIVDILPIVKECGDLSHLVTLSASRARIYEAVACGE